MTKRKRTPSPSPPPHDRAPFQIPASLQRLSTISRSLADQSDKLAGVNQDDQNMRIVAPAQALGDISPPVAATYVGTSGCGGQSQSFRAFAPRKQPSFPNAQTWVEPKPRGSQVPDAAGFMPPTQPLFPEGQAWPQPQPRKVIPWPQLQTQQTPVPAPATQSAWAPSPTSQEPALAGLEAPPKEGETLCLETQPHRIAALIAQKRAANEENRKREAWTRRAAAHRRSSQAPDDQLRSELNSTLSQSTRNHTRKAGTGEHQALRNPEQYVTSAAAITFDPVVPSVALKVDSTATAQTKDGGRGNKEPTPSQNSPPSKTKPTKNTSSHDHDSLFSSSTSPSASPVEPPKPDSEQNQQSAQQPKQHGSHVAQLSVTTSTVPAADPNAGQATSSYAKPRSKPRYADTSFIRQGPQTNHSTPVAAGYYRFHPRHWQTNNTDPQQRHQQQQQQQNQTLAPATHSGLKGIAASMWPVAHDIPQKMSTNPIFRNLTQDRFGIFGVGGKLKESVSQQSGAGMS